MCFLTDVAKEGLEIRKWFFGVWLPRVGFHACALLAGSDLISLRRGRSRQAPQGAVYTFFAHHLAFEPMQCCILDHCVGALLVWGFSNVALLRIVPLRFVKYSYTLKTLFSDSSDISFMPLYISQQANTLYKAGQSVGVVQSRA